MSRIWAGVVIAIVISILCCVEWYKLNSAFNNAEQMVIKMQDKYIKKDTNAVKTDAKKLKSYWESKEKTLHFFLSEGAIDGVSLEISSLPFMYKDENFLYYCNSILFKVRHLKEHISRSIL